MGERKGLVWPNVARIIELLKEKAQDDADFASVKSDVEKLERLTGLDPRTAVKILAGKRVQAAKLEEVANELNVPLEEIEESASNPTLSSASQMQVFENWKESAKLIAAARNSIVVIDSILFLDVEWITDLIAQAAHATDLEVSIYMASPSKAFGAQRFREMEEMEDSSNAIAIFQDEVSVKELKGYESLFDKVESRIRQQLGRRLKTLKVFEYLCMPSIRIIAIDSARFVFGFFPLFDRNPNFPCFFLDEESATDRDAALLEKLANQIRNTETVSIDRSRLKNINQKTIRK
jgi:transcriptional regulator with XRE-family HTH domain